MVLPGNCWECTRSARERRQNKKGDLGDMTFGWIENIFVFKFYSLVVAK